MIKHNFKQYILFGIRYIEEQLAICKYSCLSYPQNISNDKIFAHRKILQKVDIPTWTLSPIWSSDIATTLPFSRLTLTAEGKQNLDLESLEMDSNSWDRLCTDGGGPLVVVVGEVVVVLLVVVLLVVVLLVVVLPVVSNCPGLPVGFISTNGK